MKRLMTYLKPHRFAVLLSLVLVLLIVAVDLYRPIIYLVSVFAMILVIGTGSRMVLNGTLSL